MGLFSKFENKMEDTFDSIGDKMFDSPISPVQIAKKAEKQMRRGKMVGAGKQYAPTLYTVLVNPEDDSRLSGYYPTLAGETETYLKAKANEAGLVMDGDPLVRFFTDPDLKSGKFDVIAEAVAGSIVEQLRVEEIKNYGMNQPPAQAAADAGMAAQPGGQDSAQAPNATGQSYAMSSFQQDYQNNTPQDSHPQRAQAPSNIPAQDSGPNNISGEQNLKPDYSPSQPSQPRAQRDLNSMQHAPAQADFEPMRHAPAQSAPESMKHAHVQNELEIAQVQQTYGQSSAEFGPDQHASAQPAHSALGLDQVSPNRAPQASQAPQSAQASQAPQSAQLSQSAAAQPQDPSAAKTAMFTGAAVASQGGAKIPVSNVPPAHLRDNATGKVYTLSSPTIVLGRENTCSIVIPDANASRQHAQILYNNGIWMLNDLGSTNGTYINNQEITTRQLNPGDMITIGVTNLQFNVG